MRNIDTSDMPLENKKLWLLIKKETYGNVSTFAEKIGVSQQMVDVCFRIDKKIGRYRPIFPKVKKAIKEYYKLDDNWFYEYDEEIIESANNNTEESKVQSQCSNCSIVKGLVAEIKRLTEINERNSQSMERLVRLVTKDVD